VTLSRPLTGATCLSGEMMVVIDASALFAAVLPSSDHSDWAWHVCQGNDLSAPELVSLDVAEAMRKAVHRGFVSHQTGWEALNLAMDYVTDFYPHKAFLSGVWETRDHFLAYDASYVQLARALDVPLVTLDTGLARAAKKWCRVFSPG
jgi:predicted nucleic acid-binding protein